jgi:hypothetical protein
VNGPGDYFLAGPAFPGDEHGGLGGRHHFDQLRHLLHGGALADQFGQREDFLEIFAQAHHLAARALVLERVGYQVRKLVGVDRLRDVVVGAVLQSLHRGVHGRIPCHDDDREVRIGLAQARLQLHPVHSRHFDIDQRDIELGLLDDFERLARA